MAIRVVTDSTADLPKELAQQLGITVVPLNVHFGDEIFKDGVTLDAPEFWRRLGQGALPRTSQPSPLDFVQAWKPLLEAGDEVLSIHISHDMSGTVGAANIAREMMGADAARITVVDSHSVSMAMGMAAVVCARHAAAGEERAAALAELVTAITGSTAVFFNLDSLEMLAKNGRIGRAQAMVGGLLGIKPILQVTDGVVAPADKVRGKSKVMPRTAELLGERIPHRRHVTASIVYGESASLATPWAELVRQLYEVDELWEAPLGAVVASHVGFGVVGIILHETR